MAKDYSTIKSQAEVIASANKRENTKGRISTQFIDTLDYTKDVADDVADLEQLTSEISSQQTEDDIESIEIYDGQTLLHKIDKDSANFKNLKSNGSFVVTDISGKQDCISQIENGTSSTLKDSMIFADDNTNELAEITNDGLSVWNRCGDKVNINTFVYSNPLYGKKWVVLGDSFSEGTHSEVLTYGKYKGKLKVYPYIIGNRNDMDIVNFFAGGRTLAYPSDGTFTNSVTCPTATCYYQNIPEDADYITIYLGINDGHHAGEGSDGEDTTGTITLGTIDDTNTSTYYGAWNEVMTWLRNNRPLCHIGIIVSNGVADNNWRLAQINIAKKFGIPYIDMNGDERSPAMMRSVNPDLDASIKSVIYAKQRISGDTHPSAETHEYESLFIENFIKSI